MDGYKGIYMESIAKSITSERVGQVFPTNCYFDSGFPTKRTYLSPTQKCWMLTKGWKRET